ncbi:MAG: hypothetical protein IJM27_02025 [Eubacterium sp.]|nr:hypothetical protein [Eubacterium sp.]
MSDAVELHLRPHCVSNTCVRAQRGAAARWAALSAESTKPAGATAGSGINSMQEYESGNPHGNYEVEIFEKNLAAELIRYDIDLKDEIERSY